MATTIPNAFLDGNPLSLVGLSPLQLALADYLFKGGECVLSINFDFLNAMKEYTDSAPLVPIQIEDISFNYDDQLGWPISSQNSIGKPVPKSNIVTGYTGTGFTILGEDIFLQRIAQDCGPDEELRYEEVLVGQRTQIAQGTFAAYGKIVYGGAASSGTGYPDVPPTF